MAQVDILLLVAVVPKEFVISRSIHLKQITDDVVNKE